MSVTIIAIQQIQRINQLQEQLNSLKQVDSKTLLRKANPKKWSVAEILSHLIIANGMYKPKLEKQLAIKTNLVSVSDGIKASWLPSFLVQKFKPKDNKIQLKMKTSGMFEPQLKENQTVLELIEEFEISLNDLKNWIYHYRTENISLKKFNSALGPVVRFNIPEACEFLLAHTERHFFQIERTLKVVNSQKNLT